MSVNHPFVTVPRRHGLSGTSSFGTSLSVERKEQPNKQKEEGTMKEDEEKNVTVNAPVQKKIICIFQHGPRFGNSTKPIANFV